MLITPPAYDHVRGWRFEDFVGRRMKGGCSCASSLGFDPLTRQYQRIAVGDLHTAVRVAIILWCSWCLAAEELSRCLWRGERGTGSGSCGDQGHESKER